MLCWPRLWDANNKISVMDHIMHNKYVYQQKLWLYMQYIHVNLNVCVCWRGRGLKTVLKLKNLLLWKVINLAKQAKWKVYRLKFQKDPSFRWGDIQLFVTVYDLENKTLGVFHHELWPKAKKLFWLFGTPLSLFLIQLSINNLNLYRRKKNMQFW